MGRNTRSKQKCDDQVAGELNSSVCDNHNRDQFYKQLRVVTLKYEQVARFVERFDNLASISLPELYIRVDILTDLRSECDQLVERVVSFETDLDFQEILLDVGNLNDDICELKARIQSVVQNQKCSKSNLIKDSRPEIFSNFGHRKPKLPDIPIPNFDGQPENWIPFCNTFVALVHSDASLPGVVKYSYLLDRINKETKFQLGTIVLSDEGYENAWQTLLDNYDNKRKIVNHHIDSLLNLPQIIKDSHKDLRHLINVCVSNISALKECQQNLEGLGEQMMINIVLKKVDFSLRKEWENELSINCLPKWDDLIEFLKKKCRVLESVDSSKKIVNNTVDPPTKFQKFQQKSQFSKFNYVRPESRSFLTTNSNTGAVPKAYDKTRPSFYGKPNNNVSINSETCGVCNKVNHLIFNCPEFLLMSTHERYDKIKELKYCINCLKNHSIKNCSSHVCKICSDPHHTLLHHVQSKSIPNKTVMQIQSASCPEERTEQNISEQFNFYAENESATKTVILPTAIVLLRDVSGKLQECRALLDSCSDANYITAHVANKLKLPRIKNKVSISGLNHSKSSADEEISTTIKSKISNFEAALNFSVVPEIAHTIPNINYNITRWDIPPNLTLADKHFNMSRPIDILIGGEIFFEIISNNKYNLRKGLPILIETVFGWILTGTINQQMSTKHHTNFLLQSETKFDLHKSLQKLFEIEPVIERKLLSKEEIECEQHYVNNHYRNESGRYTVSIPLRENYINFGESKTQAIKRFLNLEQKLDANLDFKQQYSEVIREYSQLGHMKPINLNDHSLKQIPVFFMPHHAVIKMSSSTTKLRVVFDASAKSSSNLSLNEVMMVGPNVQQTCFDITIRFRKHRYVFTSDINKMYRQVLVNPSQTPLQRIMWRANKSEPIGVYELLTVTFGTASAPYLATRTLKQLALDESSIYPEASRVTQRDFYVDDVLTGTDEIIDLIILQQQLTEMLKKGGFKLHKWSSNDERILANIPMQDREILKTNKTTSSECIKTLGLAWQPKEDCFTFTIPTMEISAPITKRKIVSEVAKLYDPLGFLGPVIVTAKILIQNLWKSNTNWDEIIPSETLQCWDNFRSNLNVLNDIKINRRIICDYPKSVQIHGFADASESAYGACIYIRSVDQTNKIHIKLVCSKTRVAPIKFISLPRLELCAALLLSRLLHKVTNALELTIENVCLWSDSQITLTWIKSEPYKLKVFIANRVSEIQDLTVDYSWNYISTDQNPADVITRGILPHEIKNCHIWWNGPKILHSTSEFATNFDCIIPKFDVTTLELKKEYITLTSIAKPININESILSELINRYSSYTKLLRISAYCLRFLYNINKKNVRIYGPLSTQEIQQALHSLIEVVQKEYFNDEIITLMKKRQLPRKGALISLNPFIDSEGLLRVGGRLSRSHLDYDQKHQLVLPSKGNLTKLIFRFYHVQNLHAGAQMLVSLVRQKFWPISAKNIAKHCVRSCIICFRARPRISQQIMGDLPIERVKPARAFHTTGIDFCGPFLMKNKSQRNSSAHKVYVCVFVCFVTKAVHFEVVSDLTSKSFISCLKRFIFRRGKPHTLWSDNATNFRGAKNDLKEMYQLFRNELIVSDIVNFCTIEQIIWKFIPPRSPNFGGLWESSVKSLKTHLKRVTTNMIFSYEELNTFIVQIEGILNSRPLTALSDDPNDPSPLTPAHFLCGGSITAPAEPDLSGIPTNRLTNWEKITKAVQGFWKRYSIEYLHSLQQRNKWKNAGPNLNVNDIVLIYDEQLPSTQWLLGRIVEIHKGQDNKVRVVKILAKNKIIERSISKLCKLPMND